MRLRQGPANAPNSKLKSRASATAQSLASQPEYLGSLSASTPKMPLVFWCVLTFFWLFLGVFWPLSEPSLASGRILAAPQCLQSFLPRRPQS